MELKDIEKPKWVFETKRGWGMFLTFAGTALPFINLYATKWLGQPIDAGMVALVGETVTQGIEFVGLTCGVVLWVYGSFKPTAPLQLLPVKK